MSWKGVDIGSAMRRLADKRIEEAMREGKFNNLPGAGQPIELDDMPADENARLTWWALRILRNNGFVPDEVQMRKTLEALRARLASLHDESALVNLVGQINGLVLKINTLGTNALKSPIAGVDLEMERKAVQRRVGERGRSVQS